MFPFSAEGFTAEKGSTVYRQRNYRRVLLIVPPKYYRHFWFYRFRQIDYRQKTKYRLPSTNLPSCPIYRRDITGIFGCTVSVKLVTVKKRNTVYRQRNCRRVLFTAEILPAFSVSQFPSNWLPSNNEIPSTVSKTTAEGITVPSEFRLKYRYRSPPWVFIDKHCTRDEQSHWPGVYEGYKIHDCCIARYMRL